MCSGSASVPSQRTPAKSSQEAMTWMEVDLPMRPVLWRAQISVEVLAVGAVSSDSAEGGVGSEGFLLMGEADDSGNLTCTRCPLPSTLPLSRRRFEDGELPDRDGGYF